MSHEVSSFAMSWIDESIIFIIDMVEFDGTCCIMGSSSSPLSAPRGRRSTTQLAAFPHWPFQSAMDIPRVRHPWVSTSTRTSCPSKRSGRRRYLNGIHGVCVYIYMYIYICIYTVYICIYIYGGIYTHIVILYIQIYTVHMIISIYIYNVHTWVHVGFPARSFSKPYAESTKMGALLSIRCAKRCWDWHMIGTVSCAGAKVSPQSLEVDREFQGSLHILIGFVQGR